MYVYICLYDTYIMNMKEFIYWMYVYMYEYYKVMHECMYVCMYVYVYTSYLEKFANEYGAGFVAVQ